MHRSFRLSGPSLESPLWRRVVSSSFTLLGIYLGVGVLVWIVCTAASGRQSWGAFVSNPYSLLGAGVAIVLWPLLLVFMIFCNSISW